jgi:predicted dehydrogenase
MSVTRREFIAAAGSFAIPTLIPASALGRGGQAAPSDRITVGFIGVGKIANDYHLPELLGTKDVQALAVCDVDTNRRNHAQARVEKAYAERASKKCDAYTDYRELLKRKDIDTVVIATPENWHANIIIDACAAKKDVYCEKPLTLTLLESQRCIEAVKRHKRVFQTGSQQRSNVFGQFREAVEIIRNGRLGEIKTVHIGVGGPPIACDLPEEPMESGLDWDMWLGPAPKRPYNSILSPRGVHNHFPNWRNYREYATGQHGDMGAHHYDIAQWACYFDRTGPVLVIPPQDPNAKSGVRYVFKNGIEFIHGGEGGCTFSGTRGTLRIERGILSSNPAEIVKEPLGEKEVRLYRSPGHHRNWLDCIKSRKQPVADVEAGARTIAIVHLGNLAYRYNQRLEWNPESWRFKNSAHNAWLDRDRRTPWALPRI